MSIYRWVRVRSTATYKVTMPPENFYPNGTIVINAVNKKKQNAGYCAKIYINRKSSIWNNNLTYLRVLITLVVLCKNLVSSARCERTGTWWGFGWVFVGRGRGWSVDVKAPDDGHVIRFGWVGRGWGRGWSVDVKAPNDGHVISVGWVVVGWGRVWSVDVKAPDVTPHGGGKLLDRLLEEGGILLPLHLHQRLHRLPDEGLARLAHVGLQAQLNTPGQKCLQIIAGKFQV